MFQTDFKSTLLDKLTNVGAIDQLKSQFRATALSYMDSQGKLSNQKFLSLNSELKSCTKELKVLNYLIRDYFEKKNFDFSLSVFIPESGQQSHSKNYTVDEIAEILEIEIANKYDPILLQILSKPKEPVAIKNDSIQKTNNDSIQNQVELLKIQMQTAFEKDIESFKSLELSKNIAQEQEKFQHMLKTQMKSHQEALLKQKEYYEQLNAESIKTFKQKEESLLESQKFSMAQAMEVSKRAESEKRQVENYLNLSQIQVNTQKTEIELLKNEVESLKKQNNNFEGKLEQEMLRMKNRMQHEYHEKLIKVQVEEAALKGERMLFESKKAELLELELQAKNCLSEFESYKRDATLFKTEVQILKRENESLKFENRDLMIKLDTKAGSSALEFEILSLKKQLVANEKASKERESSWFFLIVEYQQVISSVSGQNDNDLKKQLADAKKSETAWMNECNELVKKLDLEKINKREHLKRQTEYLQLKNNELTAELIQMTRLTRNVRPKTPSKENMNVFSNSSLPDPMSVVLDNSPLVKNVSESRFDLSEELPKFNDLLMENPEKLSSECPDELEPRSIEGTFKEIPLDIELSTQKETEMSFQDEYIKSPKASIKLEYQLDDEDISIPTSDDW